MSYSPKNYVCPFCELAQGKDTIDGFSKAEFIVYKDTNTAAFISSHTWPHNAGNVLIIPNKHFENIYDITDNVLAQVYMTAKKVATAMKKIYGCDGVSMRQHNEPAGNQNVWHFHVHVLPRYKNDDLYVNHKNKRLMTDDERQYYAGKLKQYFSK
ncbi:MAG TPA: HIT domain-containing protein [Candidatus Levybacteria bacterium]|nr:HIT domain-containing protein [Candidatus Levybacteria bacterium]